MQITGLIWDLLMEHNCVIIPEFGAFVGNYKPAEINKLKQRIYPPSKQIGFNKNLINNDGLLINSFAVKANISFSEAEILVSKQIQVITSNLNQNKVVEFFRVGILFKDTLNVLRFEPTKDFNLLKESFGLESVYAIPVDKTKVIKIEPILVPAVSIVPEPILKVVERKQNQWKKIAAAAMMLPFIFYALYLSTQTNLVKGGKFHYSELNPFGSKICEVYAPRKSSVRLIDSENNKLTIVDDSKEYISFDLGNESELELGLKTKWVRIKPKHNIAAAATAKVKPSGLPTKGYHLVVGCFSIKANAENLVLNLEKQGFNASIIDYWNGLFRVSKSVYSGKREAINELNAVRDNQNPGAWIVRK